GRQRLPHGAGPIRYAQRRHRRNSAQPFHRFRPDGAAELATAGAPIERLDGTVRPKAMERLRGIAAVAALGVSDWTRAMRQALAARDGAIIPLETALIHPERFYVERHLCIDTTAAGGNASLLAAVE
ncbi:MAG: hypothetical protein AAGH83_09455, partial [Pseudomonadota bacterium]